MCIANTISVCIQRFPYTMSKIKNTFLNKNICVKEVRCQQLADFNFLFISC